MLVFYLFLLLPVGFILWRLVQWFQLKEQLEREGRDFRKEVERLTAMRLEK
jgi:hypothetical protein